METCGWKRYPADLRSNSRAFVAHYDFDFSIVPARADKNGAAHRAWRAPRSENKLISTRSQAQCPPQLDARVRRRTESDLRTAAGDQRILARRTWRYSESLQEAAVSRAAWMLAAISVRARRCERWRPRGAPSAGPRPSGSAASISVWNTLFKIVDQAGQSEIDSRVHESQSSDFPQCTKKFRERNIRRFRAVNGARGHRRPARPRRRPSRCGDRPPESISAA